MEAKLLKTTVTEYAPAKYVGINLSGAIPVGDRVLVLPDMAVDKTSGNVFLPEDMVERHGMAAESGVLVAIGEGAFYWNSDRTTRWIGLKPKPGSHVAFERYAGTLIKGDDGQVYRLMDDKCIGAILTEEKKPVEFKTYVDLGFEPARHDDY